MISQERLLSIFLEGLSSKELHVALYMKHHKNLNQCIHYAIDYDDNCGEELKAKDTSSKTSAGTSSVASQVEEITKGVMEKIQRLYGMPKLMDPQRMDRLGPANSRLDGCLSIWCEFDKKWGNHTTQECYNCIRFMRNQQMGGNIQNFALAGERPLPVLDAQPPLPNAALVRLVEHEEDDNQEQVLVPIMPYVNKTQ